MMGSLDYLPGPNDYVASCSTLRKGMDLRICELQDRLKGLEEERKKIEAFKRELPLLMQLLTDAIEVSRKRLAAQSPASPLKVQSSSTGNLATSMNIHSSEVSKDLSLGLVSIVEARVKDNLIGRDVEGGKLRLIPAKVTTSLQEESSENEMVPSSDKTSTQILRPSLEQPFSSTLKPDQPSKPKLGGAFSPFQRDNKTLQPTSLKASPDLTFSPDNKVKGDEKSRQAPDLKKQKLEIVEEKSSKEGGVANVLVNGTCSIEGAQPQRKARRCWSSDLHSCFLKALRQLGGSEVATPKQIRELMKVDGLTNDEVKSHLQKYRLHVRRACSSQPMMMPLQKTTTRAYHEWQQQASMEVGREENAEECGNLEDNSSRQKGQHKERECQGGYETSPDECEKEEKTQDSCETQSDLRP